MVGVRGFEPPAPASRTQCSTRLSYTPTTLGRLYRSQCHLARVESREDSQERLVTVAQQKAALHLSLQFG